MSRRVQLNALTPDLLGERVRGVEAAWVHCAVFDTALRQFRRVDTPQSYLLIFDFDCVAIDHPRRAFHCLGMGQARHEDDEYDGDQLHSRTLSCFATSYHS